MSQAQVSLDILELNLPNIDESNLSFKVKTKWCRPDFEPEMRYIQLPILPINQYFLTLNDKETFIFVEVYQSSSNDPSSKPKFIGMAKCCADGVLKSDCANSDVDWLDVYNPIDDIVYGKLLLKVSCQFLPIGSSDPPSPKSQAQKIVDDFNAFIKSKEEELRPKNKNRTKSLTSLKHQKIQTESVVGSLGTAASVDQDVLSRNDWKDDYISKITAELPKSPPEKITAKLRQKNLQMSTETPFYEQEQSSPSSGFSLDELRFRDSAASPNIKKWIQPPHHGGAGDSLTDEYDAVAIRNFILANKSKGIGQQRSSPNAKNPVTSEDDTMSIDDVIQLLGNQRLEDIHLNDDKPQSSSSQFVRKSATRTTAVPDTRSTQFQGLYSRFAPEGRSADTELEITKSGGQPHISASTSTSQPPMNPPHPRRRIAANIFND